jgi:hypothetical protein
MAQFPESGGYFPNPGGSIFWNFYVDDYSLYEIELRATIYYDCSQGPLNTVEGNFTWNVDGQSYTQSILCSLHTNNNYHEIIMTVPKVSGKSSSNMYVSLYLYDPSNPHNTFPFVGVGREGSARYPENGTFTYQYNYIEDNNQTDEYLYLTLKANGGTFLNGNDTTIVTYLAEDGCPDWQLETPSRSLHRFLGYYTSPNGGHLVYDERCLLEDPGYFQNTLYAHWVLDYDNLIVLDANGGQFPDGNTIRTYEELSSAQYISDYIPVKSEYVFEGFYDIDHDYCFIDNTGLVVETVPLGYKLYAKWKPISNDPWDNVDEAAPVCQAYIDDDGIMYARNFRIHSKETVTIDSFGDVYAQSFVYGDTIAFKEAGIFMRDFKLIR